MRHAAGQKATANAINILSAAGLKSSVVRISGNGIKDVDDYINKLGPEHFKVLLDGSEGAIPYELAKCREGLDVENDVGKVEYLKRAVAVLAKIESRLEREVYISRVAQDVGITKEIVSAEVSAYLKKENRAARNKEWKRIESGRTERDDINPEAAKFPKLAKAEEGIIAYILDHPDGANDVFSRLPAERFATSFHKKVYEILKNNADSCSGSGLSLLGSELSVAEMGRISYILAKSREITVDAATLDDYMDLLMNSSMDKPSAAEMSDDDFLKYVQQLRQQK